MCLFEGTSENGWELWVPSRVQIPASTCITYSGVVIIIILIMGLLLGLCTLCYTKISETSLSRVARSGSAGKYETWGGHWETTSWWHHQSHCREKAKHCCHGSLLQHSCQEEEVYNLCYVDGWE